MSSKPTANNSTTPAPQGNSDSTSSPEVPRPTENFIWLIHVFIGVSFIVLLIISFSLYSKRKREGRRSAVVSTTISRHRTNRPPQDPSRSGGGNSSSTIGVRGQQTGKVAAMTIAMSQFRGRSNGGGVRASVRFADSHNSSPKSTTGGRSGGTMEYLSPMC